MEPALTTELRDRILSADGKICPLLNAETGACLVYDVRPVACRTYGFYVDREGGLYCSEIAERKGLEDIVWGNGEAVEQRLDELGPRLSLPEWIVRSGRSRSSDHRQEAPPVSG